MGGTPRSHSRARSRPLCARSSRLLALASLLSPLSGALLLFWCFLRCCGVAPLFGAAGASRLGKQLKDVAGGKFSTGAGLNPNLRRGSTSLCPGRWKPADGCRAGRCSVGFSLLAERAVWVTEKPLRGRGMERVPAPWVMAGCCAWLSWVQPPSPPVSLSPSRAWHRVMLLHSGIPPGLGWTVGCPSFHPGTEDAGGGYSSLGRRTLPPELWARGTNIRPGLEAGYVPLPSLLSAPGWGEKGPGPPQHHHTARTRGWCRRCCSQWL